MKITLLLLTVFIVHTDYAQNNNLTTADSVQGFINLDTIAVISASNFTQKRKVTARQIDVISASSIALANNQNTGDLLINTGKVFVQKSQQGGSSPVLRGFEASRILLVIDGVRMNNAIYRSGHLQNVITTDQNSLSRVEIMYGPASTIYGSDALGGMIHLVTKAPVLSGTKKFLATGSAFARYSSANSEKTIHADISPSGKNWGWLQSYNLSDFGDTRMGRNYPSRYPDFGRRTFYVDQINGKDSIMVNPDDRVQKFSGYKQWDIIQKLLFKPKGKISHLLNFQFSNSTNVPRYDRLQDTRNGVLRFAEWYYGPQKRLLGAYELNASKLGFIDDLKVNINYQDIEESRQTRDYARYDRFDSRIENIKVLGATISGHKTSGSHEITAGMDAQVNDLKSVASRKNLASGAVTGLDTRYPNGTNNMNSYGIYAQHMYASNNQKFVVNNGIRVQVVHLKSTIADNSFFHLPDTAMEQNNVAISGNVGLIYSPHKTTNIKVSVSSAFRAPNIDDLAKIFESTTAAQQVVVPNTNLEPEYTYNLDLTLGTKITPQVNLELTGYYTLFSNAIIKAPFELNGNDSIMYNGIMSQVLASQNVNRARLYGFTMALDATFFKRILFSTTLSYSYGRFKTDVEKPTAVYEELAGGGYGLVQRRVSSKPLDHIPPVIGKTAVTFQHRIFNTEIFFLYNGRKLLSQYNPDGEDNAQYSTKDGTPAWSTVNWKGSVTVYPGLRLQVGIENLFDRNYRYFASGFSAPGRNLVVALRANW